jgi:hypothetical protein
MIIFKGKKYKFIHTMDITLDDIRAVFFPKTFHEKYKYLGSVPWKDNFSRDLFEAMEPLVIFIDNKAKPWWCPRFVLRFLHLFGDDNSIVRIRNKRLSDIKHKLTKGYSIMDYKTKWHWYDLRITVYGTKQMQDLANAIETKYYDDGCREDLAKQIKDLDPNTKYNKGYTVRTLDDELNRLMNE